jgi:serine/threonine-protein kinase
MEGITLRKAIQSDSISKKEEIFINILQGIKALHDSNVLHRDLKPENIMIQSNGNIKILDYGLSKMLDYTSITSTGNILGTFAYMSPEQISDSKHIDARSDLYSLGMIFYEILTYRRPFNALLVPEFIDKIKNESPTPPRKWDRTISNQHENIVLKLLEKEPYKRFSNIDELIHEFHHSTLSSQKFIPDTNPKFILRTYDDYSVLEQFVKDNPERKLHVNYPVNHQFRQKSLLKLVQSTTFTTLFDPATIRLAYDSYTDVKGLLQLTYCPQDYSVINPSSLSKTTQQKEYVKLVLEQQVNLNADILTSPYHYSHNTNIVPTAKRNPVEEWFDLDIKLLKESLDYRNNNDKAKDKPLYAGICINALGLSDSQYKTELLNTYAALGCDGYLVYADGINKDTNEATLYHYITTLSELQKYTQKPVIAGRLDSLGLGLICAGITGFTSGAARFESFYEDLYKEVTDAYNMYERYYFPQLLGTIAITRKDPVRLQQIVNELGACSCHYCYGKQIPDLIKPSKNTKLHYLELMHQEIDKIISFEPSERVEYFIKRIDSALGYYSRLTHVFKPNDYRHLERWKNVFSKII